MSNSKAKLATDTFLIRGSIMLFAVNIGIAYILYPHWVTFSHLALQAYTLPFFLFVCDVCTATIFAANILSFAKTPIIIRPVKHVSLHHKRA